MSMVFKAAAVADRLGLRPLVAKAASLSSRAGAFSVDSHGHWVNQQKEATFVSPVIHTSSYAAIEQAVLDNWTWRYRPQPGDTVIDVGAGIGEEAVVFSHLVGPTGRVISIEAHPETFACLKETIRRSGLTNVVPLQRAVADKAGELFISTSDKHINNSVMEDGGGTPVPAQTLDSLAEELGLGDVALLKMNIEGAEKLAVRGMTRLASRIRHAAISCHDFLTYHFNGGPQFIVKEEVARTLEAQGFTLASRPDAAESWVRDYLYASR